MFFFMKKKLYGPFHGWGSTASRLEWEPLWGGSLLFTIKFPEIAGTHFYQPQKDKQHKYGDLIQGKEYRSLCN